MSNGKFDFGAFTTKGDSLYRAQASGAPVYDKEYPEISRFDRAGQVTDEYITRGLTDWKVNRSMLNRGSYDYSGTNAEGEPVKGSVTSRGNMTPRTSYFKGEQRKIGEGMPAKERADWLMHDLMYGRQPRYGKEGEVVSPHKLFESYQKSTKGMDPFDKMRFDRDYRKKIKSMPTSLGTEDKIINSMKKIGG